MDPVGPEGVCAGASAEKIKAIAAIRTVRFITVPPLLLKNRQVDGVRHGLIAGVALALKTIDRKLRVIGVQAEALPSMKAALEKGKPVRLPPAITIADGIAVRAVGETPLSLVKQFVDEIVTVSESEIANAVLLLLEIEKTVAEGGNAIDLDRV